MSHTKKTKEHKANQQWTEKMLMLLLADSLIILISYFTALLLRFDFVFSSIPQEYLTGYLWSMPFWIISTVVVFYICRLYHSIWRLASVAELQMSGIFCWYAVHGDENAEILLFHRISAKLFTDDRYAFFLSDIAFLYE